MSRHALCLELIVGGLLACALPMRAIAAPPPALERTQPQAPISAWTLAPGQAVIESGAWFRREVSKSADPHFAGQLDHRSLAVGGVRFGLPLGGELQATFDGLAGRERYGTSYEGATDLAVALKLQLLRDREGGRISVLGGVRLPSGSDDFRTPDARPRFGILSSMPAGDHKSLHVNVLFERRPEPHTGIAGGYIGESYQLRANAIVVERVVGAWEYAPSTAWGGYVEIYYHRDPDLADIRTLGAALAGRWRAGAHLMAELGAGYGTVGSTDSHEDREWFVAAAAGYALTIWRTP